MAHHRLHGASAPSLTAPFGNAAPGATTAGCNALDAGKAPTWPQAVIADKSFTTLRARAALARQTLERVEPRNGEPACYRIGRWGLSRTLPDLQSVAAFLDHVGAP